MKRREFITLVGGAAAWPVVARAQEKRRIPRVGVLWHAASAEEEGPLFPALLEGFRDLGYVEGRNIIFEHRFPNEMPDRFRSMAAELVSLNVDVLVSSGNNATPYAKNATATIPLVFMFIADPVGTKLVESFARPGGNATGISNFSSELIPKRLQLLKEAISGLSRVAHRAGMQALLTNADGLAYAQREFIAELALKTRLPAAVFGRETLMTPAPGALLSYGVDGPAICRRAAVYVDKILKGAKPGELAVEQPTKFEFLINLKTAKALGITVPPTLLARADEVIE